MPNNKKQVTILCTISLLLANSSYANGLASSIAARHTANPNTVIANQGVNTNSREYKAQDATNQGNTGAGVAAATGGVLLGIGIPMVVSPILPVKIAGADLIAKAAQEFAQAAQNRRTAQLNQAQNNLLNSQYDSGNQTGTNRDNDALSEPLNQFQSLLQDRGVDTSRFRDQLANGEFNSLDDVLRAMGETNTATPEQMAQASRLAGQRLGEAQGLVSGQLQGIEVGMEEVLPSASPVGDTTDFSTAGYSGSNPSNSHPEGELEAAKNSQDQHLIMPNFPKELVAGEAAEKGEGTGSSFAFDSASLLNHVLGVTPEEIGSGASSLIRMALEKIGVTQSNPTQNIFQLAHRSYKGFSKWRKQTRVATSKF